MTNKSESIVVYNSGLNIWDPSDLSTLTIFYDRVVVPWCTRESCGEMVEFQRNGGSEDYRVRGVEVDNVTFTGLDGQSRRVHDFALEWERTHRLLFHENVLRRASPPANVQDRPDSWFENPSLDKLADMLLDVPYALHAKTPDGEQSTFGKII
jgi:hypothetical protein